MPYHDSGPLFHSNPATAAAADTVGLGDSRRRQRIGRGEPAGEATQRVDKADFDDDVLPELLDSLDSSDSDEDAPMVVGRKGVRSHYQADAIGVAGLRWQTESFA